MIGSRLLEVDEPLSEVTLWVDWDSVTSMILSLRIALFEHGTIPTWNFMLCGGQPELSTPFSWAYTWPSLFAYALPPMHAALAIWGMLALVGFFATRALLLRWSGSPFAATLGAAVYALCGVHAARFNAGHIPFAFFHLVPLLMLLFERSFERALARERVFRSAIQLCLASFLFMSAALPHPLIHFYPAFLLLVAYRVLDAAHQSRLRDALAASWRPLAAHAIGIWLAIYKIWPAIRWQLTLPREGVALESQGFGEVLWNTLRVVEEYGPMHPWRGYPEWEYNAFVGPLPWLLALAAAALGRRPANASAASQAQTPYAASFGLLLVAVGFGLSLGNDNSLSPAYLFRFLPIFEGVRAFARFQILIVFGLAILVAEALAPFERTLRGRPARTGLLATLAIATVAPLLVQNYYALWNLAAFPKQRIFEHYGLAARPEIPQQVWNGRGPLHLARHQTLMLEQGYWPAHCLNDLNLPHPLPDMPTGAVLPLSAPPPSGFELIDGNKLRLHYPASLEGRVLLNVRILDAFDLDAPVGRLGDRVFFEAATLRNHQITITARDPGPRQGAIASAAGLGVGAAFFGALYRRERAPESRRA